MARSSVCAPHPSPTTTSLSLLTTKQKKQTEINPSNLAPAWESIPSAPPGPAQLQLTETVVTNLTATLSLPVASLFRFGDDDGGNGNSNSNTKAADTKCKVFPGDADYPSKAEWAIFSILAGNALIETVPLGAYCFANSGVYDAARCQYLLDNWTKSEIQYGFFFGFFILILFFYSSTLPFLTWPPIPHIIVMIIPNYHHHQQHPIPNPLVLELPRKLLLFTPLWNKKNKKKKTNQIPTAQTTQPQ